MESPTPLTLGWREWVGLPDLGIPRLKAKLDTGARTSALHAFRVEPFDEDGRDRVRFWIHPLQRNTEAVTQCEADVIDLRWVSDSGGHREQRYVIRTNVRLGTIQLPVEVTLTNRDSMVFRMLLGRTTLAGTALVDSERSYVLGRPPRAARRRTARKKPDSVAAVAR